MKNILTINAGSSSLKASVYENNNGELKRIINFSASHLLETPKFKLNHNDFNKEVFFSYEKNNIISSILKSLFNYLLEQNINIDCVSHRVVHGGKKYIDSVLLNKDIINELEEYSPLAPLHQPFNIKLIKETESLFPNIKQIACFDTMFHMKNREEIHSIIAVPDQLRQEGVQKYGFHGLSYEYVTKRLSEIDFSENNKTVTAHLGSGCSMLASFGEKAITTTMGFSALDGIVMGTRSGRIDPGVILYMLQNKKWDYKTIEKVLYKESGWKGISNFSGDMKVLLNNIDKPKVKDSIDYFVKEIVFNITGFMSHLKGLDNIVFTGGVGENSPYLRKLILSELEWLGVDIDNNINENIKEGLISSKNSKIKVFVIPTNEELILAKHALKH